MVDVEHGIAGEPHDLSEAAKGFEVGAGTDVAAIKVGAADAVVMARKFAQASGEVPKNVAVGDTFAEMSNGAEAADVTGVWMVTFATDTDLADAREYEVDTTNAEVTEVKEE